MPGAVDLPVVEGHVALQQCWPICAARGQTVAIVGPSGAGKTTIANLLPRFYEVTEGRILVDGKDIRTVTMQSLRQQIGIVPQETVLFNGTVYDNILYGRLDATESEVIAAAKAANAHNPRILVLDEATSALDTESEKLVQQALDKLMIGRTSFVIAHRLSTVQRADMIVVLDKGRIVEQGTHSELLAFGGLYSTLYQVQFRET
ncbi:hypothetical protein Lal_00002547 [Lupinus albus]|nr:hypothetical protein Lal_00002547 [Lupinus albus]